MSTYRKTSISFDVYTRDNCLYTPAYEGFEGLLQAIADAIFRGEASVDKLSVVTTTLDEDAMRGEANKLDLDDPFLSEYVVEI